jgi:hypothetical protein
MVVSLMVRVMVGFQVWFGFAGADGPGFQQFGEGRRLTGLSVAELVDHDHVFRMA